MDHQVLFHDLTELGSNPHRFAQRGYLSGLAVSQDESMVAVSTEDGVIVLYDALNMRRKNTLLGHLHGAHGVTYSTDGTRLFSSGSKEVKIWHSETGQELLTLRATGSLLNHVELVDGGNALLTGRRGERGTWQIWTAPSWAEIEKAERAGASWVRSQDR